MPSIRFNQVFLLLMALATLSAFALPTGYTRVAHGTIDEVFSPVASPVRHAAAWLHDRVSGPGGMPAAYGDQGGRTPRELIEENLALKAALLNVTAQLSEFEQLKEETQLLGDARKYCTRFNVIGTDSADRKSLSLKGSKFDNLAGGMPVLYPGILVGRISNVGLAGAQVQLTTDPAFRVRVAFKRAAVDGHGFARLALERPALARGNGDGTILVLSLTMKDIETAGLRTGDWAVLEDRDDWPLVIQGFPLGRIERIGPQAKNALFAEVAIRPWMSLTQLKYVQVMTGK